MENACSLFPMMDLSCRKMHVHYRSVHLVDKYDEFVSVSQIEIEVVESRGLERCGELNGAIGTVLMYDSGIGRYHVAIQKLQCYLENLGGQLFGWRTACSLPPHAF